MKRWIAILPLAGFALLAVLFFARVHHDPHYVPDALVGKSLPDEALPLMAGGATQHLIADAPPGTVINFFASWCVPCIQEEPTLAALKAEGVRVVGVAWKDDPAKTRDFLARYGDPYQTIFVDADGRAGIDFGVTGVPETYVVSGDGRILDKQAAPLSAADAEALLNRAGP